MAANLGLGKVVLVVRMYVRRVYATQIFFFVIVLRAEESIHTYNMQQLDKGKKTCPQNKHCATWDGSGRLRIILYTQYVSPVQLG